MPPQPHASAAAPLSVDPAHGTVYRGSIPKLFNYLWSVYSRRYSVSSFRRELEAIRTQHIQRSLASQQQQPASAIVHQFPHLRTYVYALIS